MNITLSDNGNLVNTIEVVIDPSDYQSQYDAELKKRRKTAAMKGFRQGKTPMSFIKKVYANEILSNLVNDKVMSALYKYIGEQDLITIGNPIPSKDQQQLEIDYKSIESYTFSFDIGIAPEFEVNGAGESDSYSKYVPEVEEKMIDEELTKMRKMYGKREQVKDEIMNGDYVMVQGYEQEGGAAKEEGKEVSFSFLVDDVNDQYKEEILSQTVGHKFVANVYELEKNKEREFVDKYILKLQEEETVNDDFELEIIEVSRIFEAELDEAFFDKVFRENKVTSEEEARAEIRNQVEEGYKVNATNLMYRDVMKVLLDTNEFDLPNEFIENWLFQGQEEIEEAEKKEKLEEAMEEVKWSVIRTKLSKSYGIKVEESEILDKARMKATQMVRQYGLGPNYLNEVVQHILKNEREVQQIYLEVETEKMFSEFEKAVSIDEKSVSMEEYEKQREKILELDKHEE